MEYKKGNIGRVFIVRIDHGDDLLEELEKLAKLENIESASMVLLGAVIKGKLVTGPKENIVPPDPIWAEFDNVNEVVGVGNIFTEDGVPKIHLHTAAGDRDGNAVVGCLRGSSEIFMVVEVLILELTGMSASRMFDSSIGYSRLRFEQ